MNFCTLEDFLKTTKYKMDSDDKIYGRDDLDYIVVAENHVNVTNIWYEEFNSNGAMLAIEFISPDETIKDSLEVHRASVGRRITAHWDNLFKVLKPDIIKLHQTKILRIYQKYFCHCINEYIACTPAVLSDCGWLKENKKYVFISINDILPQKKKIAMDFFNKQKWLDVFQQELSVEWYQDFFKLLSYPSILTAFAYSVHAVLWNYLHGYRAIDYEYNDLNADTIYFSLCIYGNDSKLSKAVVNLFCNFFLIKKDNWTLIDRTYHISATALSDEKYKKLFRYRCVPIIFSAESGYFTRASSMLKKVQKQRNNGYWHIYPVYVNSVPIRADEILNCCTDSVKKVIPLNDKAQMRKIHLNFSVLVYKFIEYLTEISDLDNPLNQSKYMEIANGLYDTLGRKDLSAEWIDSHTPEVLLYSSMESFIHFLEKSPLSAYVKQLSHTCATTFLPHKKFALIPGIVSTNDTFLQNFHTFLQKSITIKANSEWIFEGVEARGGEKCYYFYPNEGYEHYVHFAEKNHFPALSKQKLGQKLRESNALKTTGSSNTVKRTNRHIYVYAIKQDVLEKAQNQQI